MNNLKLTLAFLLLSYLGIAQEQKQQEFITQDKISQIEEYIDHLEKENQIIGTVSIFKDNVPVYSRHFGHGNLYDKLLDPNRLKYQIGSITKMYTAVLLSELSEKGEINLNDPLSQYFEEIPNSDKINLRQMMNHTSGLGDYVTKDDSLHYWLREPVTQGQILSEIERQGVLFQPGDSVAYSNSAYYLLARILEKKYGKGYKQIVKSQITDPLQMKNTFAYTEGDNFKNLAHSYNKKEDSWTEIEEFYFLNASGVGDIISTADDMNTFINGIHNGKIISKETLSEMRPKDEDWFGEGIMKIPFFERVGYGHGGDTYGTHSVMSYFPYNDLSLAYSINGENYPTNEFAIDILSVLFDKEFEMPSFTTYDADVSLYEKYEGDYGAENFPIKIKVFRQGDILNAKGTGQPSFVLTPVSEHVFDFKVAGIVIEFLPEENSFIMQQAGQEFKLGKIE